MSKGTVFSLLRYLAACVAEEKSEELSKEKLGKKLAEEKIIFVGVDLDCAYTLYLKYIDEYKTELKYSSNFM